MPIRPEHRWLYPIDWYELSRVIRFERADGRCEHCQRPHGCDVPPLGGGRWWDAEKMIWRDGKGQRVRGVAPPHERAGEQSVLGSFAGRHRIATTRVVLATAHRDHDPTNILSRSRQI